MKKKIFFFNGGSDYFLREFNLINFFFKIKRDFKCIFFFKEKIHLKIKNKKNFFTQNKLRLLLWSLVITCVNDLSIRKATPKYLHKILDEFSFHIKNKNYLFLLNIIRKLNAQRIIIYLASVILKKTNEFNYKSDKEEIFVIYDGVLSLEVFDIISYANKFGNKSILILVNWDHAFKCHLMNPTLVLTWGKRSRQFLKDNFNLNCKEIGTPRFELAYKKTKLKNKNYAKKNYKILFAGNIIPQDDISLLKIINNYINNKNYKIKIIYRPHPFGFSQINFDIFREEKDKFKMNNVFFDKNLHLYKRDSLESYVSLFLEIDGLISSFSTLTLEAGIYKLPVLCYAINNPNDKYYNLFNFEIQCKYSPHLHLLNKYSWPIKAFGMREFFDKFDELVSQIISSHSAKRNKIINNIIRREIYNDNLGYYERLKKQIENI